MKCVRATGYALAFLWFTTLAYGLPGSGTAEDPYRIESLDDFDAFRADLNSLYIAAHIRLECDLDLSGHTFYAPCKREFRGVFDGNHHLIRNLRIEAMAQEQVGLFGAAFNVRITDLVLLDPYVSGHEQAAVLCGYAANCIIDNCQITGLTMLVHQYAGGLIGNDYGSAITNCTVSGVITGYEDFGTDSRLIGGLIGYSDGPTVVEDCSTNMTIKPYPTHTVNSIGGLIGDLEKGTVRRCTTVAIVFGDSHIGGLLGESIRPTNLVEDCFAEATVSGGTNVGGLIGRNGNSTATNYRGGTVRRCTSRCAVQSGIYGGGLIGYNYSGPIIQCCSESTVLGGSNAGGLIGYAETATIQECRSNSTVSGSQYIGGLIGQTMASISDCYALGSASSTGLYRGGLIGHCSGSMTRCYSAVDLPGLTSIRGGLVGRLSSPASMINCFWDKSIQSGGLVADYGSKSGIVTIVNVFGKTTTEMKKQSTFMPYKWDFANETANGTADLWRLCIDGTNYPHLSWEFPRQDMACPDGVGLEDLLILSAQWLVTGLTPNSGPDFTGDGNVKLDDLAALSSVWLMTPE